jgi:hypothetical protein
MPRYFFHLESAEIKVPDKRGREFSCPEEALFHAQMMIRKADMYREGEGGRWIFRIQNAHDDKEMVVLFPIRQPRSSRTGHKPMGMPAG